MKLILETPRLYLREITPDDAENAYNLNKDREVIKYTGDDAFESVAAARAFLENYKDYKQYGYGRWAVVLKDNDTFLGWCGLKYNADIDEVDLGYRFAQQYWGKGYATESAKACLEYGFGKLNLTSIIARANHENTASINVMKKLGMQFDKTGDFCGGNAVQYRISK
mgnify:CR=1 FL=1